MFSTASSLADDSAPVYLHRSVRQFVLSTTQETFLDLDVYGDGNCMYYAVVMGYLLSATDESIFKHRMRVLFDKQEPVVVADFFERLKKYRGGLRIFHDLNLDFFVNTFLRSRLAEFMKNNKCFDEDFLVDLGDVPLYEDITKPNDWGNATVLIGLSQMLKVHIQMYASEANAKKLKRVNFFECGENYPDKLYLLHYSRNHYHYLINPQFIHAVIPKGNEPNLIAALQAIGQKNKNTNKREAAVMQEFANFSRLDTNLDDIKKFVVKNYLFLSNFSSDLAKQIETYSKYYLRTVFNENRTYLMNSISTDHVKNIGECYLSNHPISIAPAMFQLHNSHKQAQYLVRLYDPITETTLTNHEPDSLWHLLLHVYSTLSNYNGELALDIQRLIERAFVGVIFSKKSYFTSCKQIAVEVTKQIFPKDIVEIEEVQGPKSQNFLAP